MASQLMLDRRYPVGTAAMATKESNYAVIGQAAMLCRHQAPTNGSRRKSAGAACLHAVSSVPTSTIDNSASPVRAHARDEVVGDAEAVAERRDEIIAAMAKTAKPYFGDVADMTYLQWLRRYVNRAPSGGNSTADTPRWAARGWPTPGGTA